MINLKSTAVKVFPSAFRGLADGATQYNPEARLTTEFNVTNLTNRLSSKDSFVISWTDSVAIFNIHGYYFEADLTELLAGDGAAWSDVYAYIRVLPFQPIDVGNTTYQAFTLVGADDDGETTTERILDETVASVDTFMGLGLQGTQETYPLDTGVYELHLLHKEGVTWSVPTASKLKFKSTEIEDSTAGKSIYEELNTGKINNITVTKPATGATLNIAEGKTLKADQSITLAGDTSRTLTLNNENKTLAGAATNLTFAGNFTTTGAYTTTLAQRANVTLTLPTTSQTLATIAGTESLTNKTINGLTLAQDSSGFEIKGGTGSQRTIRVDASSVYFDSDIIVQDAVNIQAALTINAETSVGAPTSITAPTSINAPLNVGTEIGTGAFSITSNTSSTTIIGPEQGGTVRLIAGNYTSSATTTNSESATGSTLVKRTSTGNIVANVVYASSFNGKATSALSADNVSATIDDVALSAIFEANGATVKNATNATKTSFSNNTFSGPISITAAGDVLVANLQMGKTYQIQISFNADTTKKHSLGLVTIPSVLSETVYTVSGASGHYLEIYPYNTTTSSVTCWARPDISASKTACNLYFKLIN